MVLIGYKSVAKVDKIPNTTKELQFKSSLLTQQYCIILNHFQFCCSQNILYHAL